MPVRWQSRIALALSLVIVAVASIGESDPADAQDLGGGAELAAASEGATGTVARVTAERVTVRRRARHEASDPPPSTNSISVGRHNAGRLLFSRALLDSEHVRLKRPDGGTNHGTDEMVALIERAAAQVAERYPGHRLTVGDLSRHRGGRFSPHRSHRTGRDADIGFYVVDTDGNPVHLDRFVDMRPDGTSRRDPSHRFDVERNWALVEALVGQTDVPVQYMFVWRPLRQRLLDHAASIGAPQELIDRAAIVLDQPSRGGRHDDHFHTRIYCAADDRPRCLDEQPFHAWVPHPSPEEMVAIRAASARSRQARVRAERRARERAEARRTARRRTARAAASARAAADALETPGG